MVTLTFGPEKQSQASTLGKEVLYEVWVRLTKGNSWYCVETDFLFIYLMVTLGSLDIDLWPEKQSQTSTLGKEVLYEIWVRSTKVNSSFCVETDFLFIVMVTLFFDPWPEEQSQAVLWAKKPCIQLECDWSKGTPVIVWKQNPDGRHYNIPFYLRCRGIKTLYRI